MNTKLIKELFDFMKNQGFEQGTEQYRICSHALTYMGYAYNRDEELVSDTTIDCSTLTSQSYWEGALIGIPFIADSQRKATSGLTVPNIDEAEPGDVVIKYSSLEDSPDKTWNHVGLYLGKDTSGEPWLIESASKVGVKLTKVTDFDPQGGIKRFTLSRDKFETEDSERALSLATTVPKFGRLGAKQYLKDSENRFVHRGIDCYVPAGKKVVAIDAGTVNISFDELEQVNVVEIVTNNFTIRYKMVSNLEVTSGDTIALNDQIGCVSHPSSKSKIRYPDIVRDDCCHLHVEVEVTTLEKRFPTEVMIEDRRFANFLYLAKNGYLTVPFSD